MNRSRESRPSLVVARTVVLLALAALCCLPTRARRPAGLDYEEAEEAFGKGDYNQALPLLMDFLEDSVAQASKHPESLTKAYYHIGDIHYFYKDYIGAIDYFVRGQRFCAAQGNLKWEEKFLNNICAAYIMLQNYDQALNYCEQIARRTQLGTPDYAYDYNYLKGCILLSMERSEESLPYLREALDMALSEGMDARLVGQAYRAVADYFRYHHQTDSVLAYLHLSEAWMDKTSSRWSQIVSMKALMEAYADKGDYREAIRYQKRYMAATDSLMNVREFNQIRSMHEQTERDLQTRRIKALDYQMRLHRTLTLAALAILGLTALFLIIVWRQKRRLRRAYRSLYERNKELVSMEQQRQEQPAAQPASPPTADVAATEAATPATDEADEDLYHRILYVMEHSQRYCDPDFSLPQLTAAVGSNTNYVSKVIHDKTGQNVRTFINDYRIREARRRITDTQHYGHLTLQAIAESVGYDTQTTFNRTFKRLTGITPSVYQRMAREEQAEIMAG